MQVTSLDVISLSLYELKAQWIILNQHPQNGGTCVVTVPPGLGWGAFEYNVQYAYKISLVLEIPPVVMLIFYIVCNKLSLK